jgi:hypothetical protein
VDYLAEWLREMRKRNFGDAINKYLELGRDLNQRDTIAVKHTVSGLYENPARCGSCMRFQGSLSRRQQDTLDRFTAGSPQFAAMRKLAMNFRAILFGDDSS